MTNQIGADEKKCPMCAETVKVAAVRCRFCGFDFSRSRMPASANVSDRTAIENGFSRLLKIILIVIGIALAVSFCSKDGTDMTEDPPRDEALAMMEMRPGAVKVTAAELYQAYEANEAAAQSQYGGRLLEVTGTIDGVDLDLMEDPIVKLATDNRFNHANVSLIDAEKYKAAGLAKGQKIVFLCQSIREVIGTPMLDSCVIAERL